MSERTSIQHPRVPIGCDQQGRYPEAASCCTEIGFEDIKESPWEWIPVFLYPFLMLAILVVLALVVLHP
jgi:hypothetical protein